MAIINFNTKTLW